jgi:serine/threonine protein kinase/Tfp pilus assembly protein PilF
MTTSASTPRAETVVGRDTDGRLPWALRLASMVREQWRRGEPPDMTAVLASHPGLKNHRTIVFGLAYDEYRLRRNADESLDAMDFSRRFQSLGPSLYFFITLRSGLEDDPEYAALLNGVAWPEPGSHFLGFDLIGEIGRGGLGRVFLALERALGQRQVVVKVALQNAHEAEILGRLRHANIVPVYSVQEDKPSGLTVFCMPYLGQATLAAVLDGVYADGGPPLRAQAILDAVQAANQGADPPESPPPDRILRNGSYVEGVVHLGVQLAEALAHAHRSGIFHRDLKPSNILMSPDGRPLLLDFNFSADQQHPIRGAGGTLPYMPPEELDRVDGRSARSSAYDPRSDLFSLGVILYQLLTERLPFGEIPCELSLKELAAWLRRRQADGPRPLQQYNRQVDRRLAGLIDRCLACDPGLRPADAGALAAALRQELSPARRGCRWLAAHRRLTSAIASAALALLLATAAFLILRPPYAVRQLRQGLVCGKAGKDALALDCLNASLRADPAQIDALTARARVYQHQGRFELALADFETVSRLTPGPRIDACKGYCLSQLAQHKQAAEFYSRALAGGYDAPAVLNNLGYSWFRLGRFTDAEACLRRATEADDALQAPHHNLVLVFLRRAYAGKAVPTEAFVHARRALETGPASGELFRDLANLYALAAKQDAAQAQAAIGYVAQAVDFGIDGETFKSDPAFSGLKQDPAFQAAIAARGVSQKPVEAVQVIDPSGEWPSP